MYNSKPQKSSRFGNVDPKNPRTGTTSVRTPTSSASVVAATDPTDLCKKTTRCYCPVFFKGHIKLPIFGGDPITSHIYIYGCFLKWWVFPPFHTPMVDHFLVGKPHGFVGETHHFRKHPYGRFCGIFPYNSALFLIDNIMTPVVQLPLCHRKVALV